MVGRHFPLVNIRKVHIRQVRRDSVIRRPIRQVVDVKSPSHALTNNARSRRFWSAPAASPPMLTDSAINVSKPCRSSIVRSKTGRIQVLRPGEEFVHQCDGHLSIICPSKSPNQAVQGYFSAFTLYKHTASIQATTSGSILKTGRISGPHALPFYYQSLTYYTLALCTPLHSQRPRTGGGPIMPNSS